MPVFDHDIGEKTATTFEVATMLYHAATRCGCSTKPGLSLSARDPSNEPIDWFGLSLNGEKFSIGVFVDTPSSLTFLTGTHRIDKDTADRLGIGEIYESRWPSWSGKFRLRRRLDMTQLGLKSDPAEAIFDFLKESIDLAIKIAPKKT